LWIENNITQLPPSATQIVKRDRRLRALLIIALVTIVAIGLDAWFYPHYAAPIAGVLFAFNAINRIADAMAPCILFTDELDKGLAGVGGQGDSGVSTRLGELRSTAAVRACGWS
jgi:hypothetical protein